MKSVDITVIKIPDYINFYCPDCGTYNKIDYDEGVAVDRDVLIQCEDCEQEFKVDSVDWD